MFRETDFIKKLKQLVLTMMNFFLAFTVDKQEFEKIVASTKQPLNYTPEIAKTRRLLFLQAGFTSSELTSYISAKYGINNMKDLQRAFNLLLASNFIGIGNHLLTDVNQYTPALGLSTGNRYKITDEGLLSAIHGLSENVIFGFPYIIEKYADHMVIYATAKI